MFMGPFDQTIAWSTDNMIGSRRFIERFTRLFAKVDLSATVIDDELATSKQIAQTLHRTIKKVGEDIDEFSFNTAISTMMILLNALEKEEKVALSIYFVFMKILAPFAPHITEELLEQIKVGGKKHFSKLSKSEKEESSYGKIMSEVAAEFKTEFKLSGNNKIESIHLLSWPKYNPDYLVSDEVVIMVQVNGKVRATIETNIEDSKDEEKMKKIALQIEAIRKRTGDKSPDRIIFVPGKLINLVFNGLIS
jgi:leucyl-tRNA synthetase